MAIMARVDPALRDRLNAVAAEREIGANQIIVRALEAYLDRLLPLDEVLRTAYNNGRPEGMSE